MAEGSFGPITDDGRWTNPAPIAGSATNVVTQETQLTAASKKKNILHSAVEQWKSASLPQKIIAGLLPFAFVAVFIVFDNDEPEAKSTPKSASSTVASVQKMDAGSAAASAPPTQDKPSDEPPVGTAATEDAGNLPSPKGKKRCNEKRLMLWPPATMKGLWCFTKSFFTTSPTTLLIEISCGFCAREKTSSIAYDLGL